MLMKAITKLHRLRKSKLTFNDVRTFTAGLPPIVMLSAEDHSGAALAVLERIFHGLQQKFLASSERNEIFSHELIGNIKKPDKHTLDNLRVRMNSPRS
jgi:hypothetical protein